MRRSFVRSSGNIELNLSSPTKEKEGLIVDKQSVENLTTWRHGKFVPVRISANAGERFILAVGSRGKKHEKPSSMKPLNHNS